MHARRALIYFYVRFYLICLLLVIFIDKIFFYKYLLLAFNGFIWVPQIIKNAVMKATNMPDTNFIISMTLTQCLLPLYLNGCPSNQFVSETHLIWSVLYISFVVLQVMTLIMQK